MRDANRISGEGEGLNDQPWEGGMRHLITVNQPVHNVDSVPPCYQSQPNDNLMEQVLHPDNLNRAWKKVKSNKGAPGIDGLRIDQFMAHYGKGLSIKLVDDIRHGRYRPYPVKRVFIEKEDGSLRGLGIPTVFDRVIQQAITQIISPIFDATFSDSSFGFRKGCSQHQAVEQVHQYVKDGRRIAIDVDLSKFFDRVNHDSLMSSLGKRIKDKVLLQLIGRYLRAGIVENGVLLETQEGVPQGGPLSPLLSNIVLDPLDKELERRGHKFARYADDFIILVYSQRAGDRVMTSITYFIERKLKLKVNDQKSKMVPTSQACFLGFTFHGKSLKWHHKCFLKFKHKVRQLTGRSWGVAMEKRIQSLNAYMRGWINYFGIGQGYQLCIDLDVWIRRQLRMCYWKQWRKARTRIRNLISLGLPVSYAILAGSSAKSYWRSAKTQATNAALSLEFFASIGLVSLRDRWVDIHYGDRTADCGPA